MTSRKVYGRSKFKKFAFHKILKIHEKVSLNPQTFFYVLKCRQSENGHRKVTKITLALNKSVQIFFAV